MKSTSTQTSPSHNELVSTIESYAKQIDKLQKQIQELQSVVRDQLSLLQEHGLADYGN